MNRHQEEGMQAGGADLGEQAVEHVAQYATEICNYERQRLVLTSEPRINELHAQGSELTKHKRGLEDRLHFAPAPHAVKSQRRRVAYYWTTGIALAVAAFFFALLSFEPFRLGWKGWLYCVGVGIVTPFAVEVFLDLWKHEQVMKAVAMAVFLAALAGGALLASVRGDLLAQQTQTAEAPVTIEGDGQPAAQPQNSFYDSTRKPLRILMLLFAFAMDLGAGVAIHRAMLLGAAAGDDAEKLTEQLVDVNARLAAIIHEITSLTNAPAAFEARFWRDFYGAMLRQTARKAVTKLLAVILCLSMVAVASVHAVDQKLNLVVLIDLSASVAGKGPDGKTDFEKNVAGVARLLTSVPAGARVTILGITANSFAEPDILLSAEITEDPGYFGERLASGRRQLASAWLKRASQLKPTAKQTDILGALQLGSQLLGQTPDRKKMLLIFSDMRQATHDLDLESGRRIDAASALAQVEPKHLVVDLQGAAVTVLGADGSGFTMTYWEGLKSFWEGYFQRAGASLQTFSAFRAAPDLAAN